MLVHRAILVSTAIALLASPPAFAGHIKPGQWRITTTTRYVGVDKFPPIVTGRLAMQGIVFPTRPQTSSKTVCISPDEAAIDRLPHQNEDNGACDAMVIEPTSDGYSGKAVCDSYLAGHIWFDVSFTGDGHYEGKTVFKGKSYGLALETWNNFTGEWSGADCSVPVTP